MGKTADLVMVQKTSLTPSTKRVRHRGSLLKEVAVQGVLYQSILNAKLTGRSNLGKKRCTSNRDDRKLENTVKQSRFKHLGELHKEWTEAEVSASRVTTLRHLQEKATKTLLKQKHHQKHLTWAKEKNNWTVAKWSKVLFSDESNEMLYFIWKSRSQSLEKEWRSTEYMLLEVQCEVSTVSDDLGCHVICWCWSTSTRRFSSTLSFHLLTNCMEMLISFSSKI